MIAIRACAGQDELAACVALQVETWGYDASEIVPLKSFLLAQKIGGQVIGAFDGGETPQASGSGAGKLVAFALALPGIHSDGGRPTPYLHSHMLAVREGYRDRGLGARLKREQRREALERGIRTMEWTFDPLEVKNAYLNLHKLGAIVRSYRVDFYGASSSRLQAGLPTDRLVAEWHMDSPRVEAILAGDERPAQTAEEQIVVPARIYDWKSSDAERHRALDVLMANRRKFQSAFAKGLAVIDFVRDAEGNGIFVLGAWNENERGSKGMEIS